MFLLVVASFLFLIQEEARGGTEGIPIPAVALRGRCLPGTSLVVVEAGRGGVVTPEAGPETGDVVVHTVGPHIGGVATHTAGPQRGGVVTPEVGPGRGDVVALTATPLTEGAVGPAVGSVAIQGQSPEKEQADTQAAVDKRTEVEGRDQTVY